MKVKEIFHELSNIEYIDENIRHQHITGTIINRNNESTKQNIHIITKISDQVKLVSWSAFEKGTFIKKDTLELVNDFTNVNNNYDVIAAMNADYFNYDGQSINANVIYNNRIIKANNHPKYSSIEFGQDGKKRNIHKYINSTKELFLTINNKDTIELDENTEIVYEKSLVNKVIKYYSINNYSLNEIEGHLFIEGKISKEFTNDSIYINTSDEKVISFLNNEPQIIIQNQITNLPSDSIIVGYDTNLIIDNKVLSFEELTGQNYDHNHDRHPRSGCGYDKEGNFKIITIDGRIEESSGVDLVEMATIMKYYGFVEAYNFDGGGSTQMVVNKNNVNTMVNLPCEIPYRIVGNILILVKEK